MQHAQSTACRQPASFKVGDSVLVERPVGAPWVKYMGMDSLMDKGGLETWLAPAPLNRGSESSRAFRALSSPTALPQRGSAQRACVPAFAMPWLRHAEGLYRVEGPPARS